VSQQAFSTDSALRRGLGLTDATAFVIGAIIGAGIFRTPGIVAEEMGAPGPTLLVWVFGGVLSLCGALTVAELGAMMPRAGGYVVYLKEAYPPIVSFLFVWLMFFVIRPASAAAIATVFAEYADASVAHFVETPTWLVRALAVSAILLLGVLNIRGVEIAGWIQRVATTLKLLGVAVIIVLGLTLDVGSTANLQPLWPESSDGWLAGFGTAMIACTFTYGGWGASANLGGEVRDPRRNIPLSIFIGTGVVIGAYLLINATYLFVLPFEQVATADGLVAARTMEALAGSVGLMFISGAVMISTFGVMGNGVSVTPRYYYAMAEQGLFFRVVARVHPTWRTPWVAIAAHCLAAVLVLLLLEDFASMMMTTAPAGWVFTTLAIASIFILRRRHPDAERPYRTWGYPFTPALFVLGSLAWLGSVVVEKPEAFLYAGVVALVALPVWFGVFRPREAAD